MIATHNAEARTFTMAGQFLTGTYPVEDFAGWLDFYRGMQADYLKAKGVYDASVVALEALERELAAA